ncbi:TIGR03808 family TAT-translocated repetitive protein [Chelatococcus sp. SYSU_G07232]|uniref:TIGR03808 family TAT-translocated repetitive protein n=1 Tax=Chelatococcus albus TaxID=3047466 RepID=A0ABT7AIP2_9HYPH|nr:TIGR03808 family TAT-translocated repetitive protein [Chelatococcus sp. SYSU_G07232]MDJ1159237.1 TIGR03808 family TAT-translocated repetitive protein [Chelatococcus sp. SYSU_G07232]
MPTSTSLNAFDFGMIANSGTDQTANFQNAIDQAGAQGKPLYIPAGVYNVNTVGLSQTLEIYATKGSALFVPAGGSMSLRVAPAGAGRVANVVLRGLSFDGASQNPSSVPNAVVDCSRADRLLIADCEVRNAKAKGIALDGCQGVVRNNVASNCYDYAIFSYDGAGVAIEGNTLLDNANNGIGVWRGSLGEDGTVIRGNRVQRTRNELGGTGQYGNGIVGFRAGNVIAVDNFVTDSAFSAIRYNSVSNGHIACNECLRSREAAIWVEAPGPNDRYEGGIVSGNTVKDCGAGILAVNVNFGGRRVVVVGNQIVAARAGSFQTSQDGQTFTYTVPGRGVHGEGDVLVTGNIVEDVDDWGVVLVPVNFDPSTVGAQKILAQATDNMLKRCAGGIGFVQSDTIYGRAFVGGNVVGEFRPSTKFAAICAVNYDGSNNDVSRVSGAADLGNATSSPYPNVAVDRNFSFT